MTRAKSGFAALPCDLRDATHGAPSRSAKHLLRNAEDAPAELPERTIPSCIAPLSALVKPAVDLDDQTH